MWCGNFIPIQTCFFAVRQAKGIISVTFSSIYLERGIAEIIVEVVSFWFIQWDFLWIPAGTRLRIVVVKVIFELAIDRYQLDDCSEMGKTVLLGSWVF